ncbi:ABC transporter permease [Amorphus sp. 3PC139-8]|uniref:ABC transporter permease n=1 Tax=Amorphus sp. 3PC139-8 TaxID=2735676 RepID=UPI00345DF1FF
MTDLTGTAAAARRASGAGRSLPSLRMPPQVRKILLGLLGGAVLISLFEILTRFAGVPEQYLPHATGVVVRFVELAFDPVFLSDVAATLWAWALGIAIALGLGVAFGLWLGLSPTAHEIGLPIVNLLRPIPSVCIIPLAILVIGQGLAMKLLLVSYAALWPILINTVYGVHGADPVATDTARCFGLPRGAILRRIVLPQAAPMIFTGLKISASIGLVVLVSAELLAATSSGIGAFIFRVSSSGGHMDSVLAGAAYAGVLGVIVNAGLAALDRRWFGWSRREADT